MSASGSRAAEKRMSDIRWWQIQLDDYNAEYAWRWAKANLSSTALVCWSSINKFIELYDFYCGRQSIAIHMEYVKQRRMLRWWTECLLRPSISHTCYITNRLNVFVVSRIDFENISIKHTSIECSIFRWLSTCGELLSIEPTTTTKKANNGP